MKFTRAITTIGLLSFLSSAAVSAPEVVKAQTAAPTATPLPATPMQEYNEYMRLGFAAYQDENYADAANYFRAALYAVPNDREATTAYWNSINALNSPEVSGRAAVYEENMELGYDATESDDYPNALEYFQTALQQRPGDYYATQAIRNVQTYINRGTQPDSSTDVPPTVAVYPGELPYDRYMRLGYAAAQREDFAAAIAYFRSALYEQPNDQLATTAYWNAVDGMQDGEFGLDETTETAYDRYMRLGYDATNRGDYERALNFFERAITERPQDGYAVQAIRN
ncbi:MAG: tetratricopeptide repeat protein, partial [Phormidesmis sp.]